MKVHTGVIMTIIFILCRCYFHLLLLSTTVDIILYCLALVTHRFMNMHQVKP